MRVPDFLRKNEPHLRRLALIAGGLVLLVCAARAFLKPGDGDFELHRETGRRFLANEFLYAGAHDFPYPPLLGALFAPAALLPLATAKILYHALGTAALLGLLWILQRMVRSAFQLRSSESFWTSALAIFLAIQFIIRDQAEVGINSIIVALTWLGFYLWREKRDLAGGVAIGLATAIKCTPAIFIGYFIWKRQWRIAAGAICATILFTLTPMLRQGPIGWKNHITAWTAHALEALTRNGPGYEVISSWQTKNFSLGRALSDHLGGAPNRNAPAPGSDSHGTLNLPSGIVRALVNAAFVAIGVFFLAWSAGTVGERDDPRLLWEAAAAGVLMFLLSPIAWTQHGVALLPACYLVAALFVRQAPSLPKWTWIVFGCFALFCAVAGRDLLPRQLSDFISDYDLPTWCMVGLLALVFAGPRLQQVTSSRPALRI